MGATNSPARNGCWEPVLQGCSVEKLWWKPAQAFLHLTPMPGEL